MNIIDHDVPSIPFKLRAVAALSHLLGAVGWLLIPLNVLVPREIAKRHRQTSRFVEKHAMEASNFGLACIIYFIVALCLFFALSILVPDTRYLRNVVLTVTSIVVLAYVVLVLGAIVRAMVGKEFVYPIWPKLLSVEERNGVGSK